MLSVQGKIILFTKPICDKVFAGFNIFVAIPCSLQLGPGLGQSVTVGDGTLDLVPKALLLLFHHRHRSTVSRTLDKFSSAVCKCV